MSRAYENFTTEELSSVRGIEEERGTQSHGGRGEKRREDLKDEFSGRQEQGQEHSREREGNENNGEVTL